MRSVFFFLTVILLSFPTQNRGDEPLPKQKKGMLNGYLKDLRTLTFSDGLFTNTLIHNRLNYRMMYSPSFQYAVELRNRIYFGETLRHTPELGNELAKENRLIDLTWLMFDAPSSFMITNIDRLYAGYRKNQWHIRAGRQRLNWGIHTFWNPNDLFNTYSFFDFDYEERPGSDALSIQYYSGFLSSAEFAVNVSDNIKDLTMAARYRSNYKKYDWQWVSGISNGDFVLGGGWAGQLFPAGFKGEWSWFLPFTGKDVKKKAFVAAASLDHSMKNGLFLQFGYLFSSKDSSETLSPDFGQVNFSARNLSPFKHTIMAQTAYPLSPILTGSVAILSDHQASSLFLNPSITYSLTQNFDFSLVGQVFIVNGVSHETTQSVTSLFTRFKVNF